MRKNDTLEINTDAVKKLVNKISFLESKDVCSGRDFKDQEIKDSSPFLEPLVMEKN